MKDLRLPKKPKKIEDLVAEAVVVHDLILFIDVDRIPDQVEQMKILIKLNLRVKEAIPEGTDTGITADQDLIHHDIADIQEVAAEADLILQGDHILLSTALVIHIMMIVIIDMEEKVVILQGTTDRQCLVAGDMLEIGIILNPADA